MKCKDGTPKVPHVTTIYGGATASHNTALCSRPRFLMQNGTASDPNTFLNWLVTGNQSYTVQTLSAVFGLRSLHSTYIEYLVVVGEVTQQGSHTNR